MATSEQQERDSRQDPHEEMIAERKHKVWVIVTRIRQIVNDASDAVATVSEAADAIAKAEAKITVAAGYQQSSKVSTVFGEHGSPIPGASLQTGLGSVPTETIHGDEPAGAEAEI